MRLSSNESLIRHSSFIISHNTETWFQRLFNKELRSELKLETDFFIRRPCNSRKLRIKQLLSVSLDATTNVSKNRRTLKWIYVPALERRLQKYTSVSRTNLNIKK